MCMYENYLYIHICISNCLRHPRHRASTRNIKLGLRVVCGGHTKGHAQTIERPAKKFWHSLEFSSERKEKSTWAQLDWGPDDKKKSFCSILFFVLLLRVRCCCFLLMTSFGHTRRQRCCPGGSPPRLCSGREAPLFCLWDGHAHAKGNLARFDD